MARCPNCGQETIRTTDLACALCGFPLPNGGFKSLQKTYLELLAERQALASPPPVTGFTPPPESVTFPEPEPVTEAVIEPEPEPEAMIEPEPEVEPEAEPEAAIEPEAEVEPEPESEPEPEVEPEAETVLVTPPPVPEAKPEAEPEPEPEVEPEAETVLVTPPPVPEAELPPPPDSPPPAPAADSEVTIEQINEAYTKDTAAADRANEGRHFKLSGIVESVGRDLLDNPYIKLRAADEKAVLRVRCTGSGKEYEARVAELSEGQTISVHGTYDGFLVNILLKDCTILD